MKTERGCMISAVTRLTHDDGRVTYKFDDKDTARFIPRERPPDASTKHVLLIRLEEHMDEAYTAGRFADVMLLQEVVEYIEQR